MDETSHAYEYNYNDNSITPLPHSHGTFGASESFLLEHGATLNILVGLEGSETEASTAQGEESNTQGEKSNNRNLLPYTPTTNDDPNDNDGFHYDSLNVSVHNGSASSNNLQLNGGLGIGFKRARSHNQSLCNKEPSVTELDRIQRQRREESERRNAELQSFSIMEKLRQRQNEVNASNADVHHRVSGLGLSPEDDFFTNNAFFPNVNRRGPVALRTRRRSNESFFNTDFNNANATSLSPNSRINSGGISISNLITKSRIQNTAISSELGATQKVGKKQRSAPPPPKLNITIRPQKHAHSAFHDQEQPVIIGQETDCSNNLGELFLSPHSNKFVLQFPDAPQEELTLHDEIDEEDATSTSQEDFQGGISEHGCGSSYEPDRDSGNHSSETGLNLSPPLSSSNHDVELDFSVPFNTPIFTLGQGNPDCDTPSTIQAERTNGQGRDDAFAIPSHRSPSDASTSLSPNPVNNISHKSKRGSRRKKKILLRPKHYQGKIFDTSKTMMDIEHEDCGVSPCPSINSSSTGGNTNKIAGTATLKAALPLDRYTDHQSSDNTQAVSTMDTKLTFQGSRLPQGHFKSLDEMTNELTINDHSTLPLYKHPLPSRLPSQLNRDKEEHADHMDLSRGSGPSVSANVGTLNVAKLPGNSTRIGSSVRGGAFLSLRPKRGRQSSLTLNNEDAASPPAPRSGPIPSPYADEGGDKVMELDPNLSFSRDADCSLAGSCSSNAGPQKDQHYDDTLNSTPQHFRNISFLPTPSPTHSGPAGGHNPHLNQNQHHPHYWTRSLSSNSISDQFEMAKEAAARFGGQGASDAFSPSNLSESNFRTPNPESSAKRRHHWFQGNIVGNGNINGVVNPPLASTKGANANHDGANHISEKSGESSHMVELLLPKLFLSPSEEQLGSSAPRCGNSNSFLGKVKEAFSPPMSWKKSPKSSSSS